MKIKMAHGGKKDTEMWFIIPTIEVYFDDGDTVIFLRWLCFHYGFVFFK